MILEARTIQDYEGLWRTMVLEARTMPGPMRTMVLEARTMEDHGP